LEAVVRNKPDALILDFFAGSGTTLHATALLNAEDNGRRRCILVTNNEVSEGEAKSMTARGLMPSADEWEAQGICRSVTVPRCKYALQGHRDDGTFLSGSYPNGRSLKEGFSENLCAFRLDFLDPSRVERGCHFEDIAPVLWLMAGAQGVCSPHNEHHYGSLSGERVWWMPPGAPLAVLLDEHSFSEFLVALQDRLMQEPPICLLCLVTDSEGAFNEMRDYIQALSPIIETRMLYRNYLDNFQLQDNTLLEESPYLSRFNYATEEQPRLFNPPSKQSAAKAGTP
jgi:adenine-specific DNA-methyltransferase